MGEGIVGEGNVAAVDALQPGRTLATARTVGARFAPKCARQFVVILTWAVPFSCFSCDVCI